MSGALDSMVQSDGIKPAVTWLPTHPAEGWFSMFNYWRGLEEARQADDPFEIRCPFALSQWQGRRENRWRRALNRFVLYPRTVRRLSATGIAHVLDHSSAYLLDCVPSACPSVVTVHDLIPLIYHEELTARQVARFRTVVERIKRAAAVVAVSRYTAGEVERLLEVDRSRIHVVPNGVCYADEPDRTWSGVARCRQWKERNKGGLLVGHVGSALPRKNLPVLATALERLAERGVRFAFARVGDPLPDALGARFAAAAGQDAFFEFEGLDTGELSAFYEAIDVLAMPSTYEGFGLPVLEAMHAGTPVVCSNTTSLPEVGGEAALYCSPRDPDELADRLAALQDPDRREALGKAGAEHAARFSWRRHLEGLFEVYRSVMS